jgi:hypothetical protein
MDQTLGWHDVGDLRHIEQRLDGNRYHDMGVVVGVVVAVVVVHLDEKKL